jgi:kynurenine formamidase
MARHIDLSHDISAGMVTYPGLPVPEVEHLTNLDELPGEVFRFTAVPPKIESCGTFTVRAYATVV